MVKVTSEVVNMCPIVAYNWFHFGCLMKTITNELLVRINPEKHNSTYVLYVHKPTYFMFAIRNACLRTYA